MTHPRNYIISLDILLVWACHSRTTFPLMQPIVQLILSSFCMSYFPLWTKKFWLRFMYTLEMIYLFIYCLYEPATAGQPFHLCSQLMQIILSSFCTSYFPLWTKKFWLRFMYTLEIIYLFIYCLYEPATAGQPFH